MKYLIDQPAGVGDIFFLQKIAKKLIDRGDEVYWPVCKEIYPHIEYIKSPVNYYIAGTQHYKTDVQLCFKKADTLFPGSVMLAKYKMVQEDWTDWDKWFQFTRNPEKEEYVYTKLCNIQPGEKYIFVNRNFGSPPNERRCVYLDNVQFDCKVVEMQITSEFTLFDWCKVLENATEIHTVETSLNYIIEKLNVTDKLHMYSKWVPSNYMHIDMLFMKPWIYHK